MIRSSAIWDTGRTPLHSRSVLILDTFIRGLMGVVYGRYLCVCTCVCVCVWGGGGKAYLLTQQLVQILRQRRVKKDEITAPD